MKKSIAVILFCALFQMVTVAREPLSDSLALGRPQSTGPNDLMVGKVSGVRVTTPNEAGYAFGGGSMDIRGINTIHGNNQPLYIIDGVELGPDFSRSENPFWNYPGFVPVAGNSPLFQLNSYDIRSITVLKDVSATSLYGSKGANGVVIINTTDASVPEDGFDIRTNFGPAFNHHLAMSGSRGQAVYNFSVGYSGIKNHILGDRQDLANLKLNYRSHSGELLWYGVNVLGSFGKISNPDAVVKDTDDDATRFSALASAYIRLNFTKWLNWTTTAGFNFRDQTRYFWYGDGNAIGRDYKGLASVSGRLDAAFNVKTELVFNRYFNERHHLEARIGAEYHGENSRMNVNNGNDFISFDLRARGINLASSSHQLHNYSNSWGHDDFYVSAAYGFGKYFSIAGSLRADNTPEFDKGGFILYPAANLSVDLHEIIIPESRAVSTVSIEAGYGKSGKEENTPAGFLTDFIPDTFYPISREAEPYYDGLYRLVTSEINAGIRLGFASDRIVAGVKYYRRSNEDSFNIYSIGEFLDNTWIYAERCQVQSRTDNILNAGYEIDLNAEVLRLRNVSWTVSANACYNNNVITSLDNRDARGAQEATGTFYRGNVLGYGVGSFLGFQVGPDGYYADLVRDGKITDADRVVLGNCTPKWFGGLGTCLKVKNFSFDLAASWAVGFSNMNLGRMVGENRTFLTARYLYPADYFTLQRAAARYDIPLKNRKVLKDLSVEVSYCNVIINNLTSVGVGLKF